MFQYVVYFLLGAIIGSFLNVVIYRLHTGKSLSGHSHCMSCAHALRWYELIPVFSYLFLRGSCASCASQISPRYIAVELLTAVLFVLVGALYVDVSSIVLSFGIASVLVVVLVYDIRHLIIPDQLIVALLILAVCFVVLRVVLGVVQYAYVDVLLGLMPAAVYASFWLVSRGRWMGLGDAKLALPLGLILSIYGFSTIFSFVVFSFWIGAIVSVGLIIVSYIQTKSMKNPLIRYRGGKQPLLFFTYQLTMKSEVPFAPFIIAAFLISFLYHTNVFMLVSGFSNLFI